MPAATDRPGYPEVVAIVSTQDGRKAADDLRFCCCPSRRDTWTSLLFTCTFTVANTLLDGFSVAPATSASGTQPVSFQWFRRRRVAAGLAGVRVSTAVPRPLPRQPIDRAQTGFRMRDNPSLSHSWQRPVAVEFLSASRGRSVRSSCTSCEPPEPPNFDPARGPPTNVSEFV